jgi:hypothetical protein
MKHSNHAFNAKKAPKEITIIDTITGYEPDSARNTYLRNSVERFIIKTLQPASLIDFPEFNMLLKAFDPKYSRQTFTEKRIPVLEEKCISETKKVSFLKTLIFII